MGVRIPQTTSRKNATKTRQFRSWIITREPFLHLYNDLLDETGLIYKPSHIFNADESEVDLNSKAGMVVVATKSKHTYTEQKSLRDHVTTLVCCSE